MVQRPRGTRDFLPEDMVQRRWAEGRLRRMAELWNFREISTPVFEHAELFKIRSGEGILEEMYAFKDRSGRELALRPELTAPTMRVYIESMRNMPKPLKLFYFGPCYRYERTQKGRYREFWQFGVEILGGHRLRTNAENIAFAYRCLEDVGVDGIDLRIGHLQSLRALIKTLGLTSEEGAACMRAVDKGDLGYLDMVRGGDVIQAYISSETTGEAREVLRSAGAPDRGMDDLEACLEHLEPYDVPYRVDFSIVRGLDYYEGMVFEAHAPNLGAESQVCGGGEYRLLPLFGGEDLPTVGFALGFDRVLMASTAEPERRGIDFFVVPVKGYWKRAVALVDALRKRGIHADIEMTERSLSKATAYADAAGARAVVYIGEKEAASGKYTVKILETGEQRMVSFEEMVTSFSSPSSS